MSENLIECGDHQWSPWSIVCVHLMEQTSKDWVPIDSNFPEVDHDWVCPECEKKMMEPEIDDLRCICIHCVRILRREHDTNFVEFEI